MAEPVKLRGLMNLLINNRRYRAGDLIELDAEHAQRLIDAGSAIPYEVTPPRARARPLTAEPGLPGLSSDGDPDALVGKAPKRRRRALR